MACSPVWARASPSHVFPCPLQNTCLKTWGGKPENKEKAQAALLKRAAANSAAQLGKYDPSSESKEASVGMYEKGYTY